MSKAATRWQVMKTATSQLGYVERGGPSGRNGNITKYWKAYYPQWQGAPWCGAFVYWCLRRNGVDDAPVGKTEIFSTIATVNAAKAKGVWRDDSKLSQIKPGDLVLFDFGTGGAKHVGFAEKYLGRGMVQTIEGNTSSSNRGSQNDGGGVYRRVRGSASIMGFVDMDRWLAKNGADMGKKTPVKPRVDQTALRKKWRSANIATHGTLTVATIKRLQAEVGTTIDGKMGPATRKAVQKWVGVTPDGKWGAQTHRAIQKKVGVKSLTGRWTPYLIKALQVHLNKTRGK